MNTNKQENDVGSDTHIPIDRVIEVYVKAKKLFDIGKSATEAQIDSHTALTLEEGNTLGSEWESHKDFELLKDEPSLFFKSRGRILAKGKGEMKMYFVETKLT